MKGTDITFTLRMSQEQSEALNQIADELNASKNQIANSAIKLFIDSYKDIILHNQEEFRRFLAQKL